MSSSLTQTLLLKYEKNQLGSVYLARYGVHTDPKEWGHDFLKAITPLQDHPDVLWVELDKKENSYKVESQGILDLLKFLNYKAFELKKKFIFITDAHLLSTVVSNKLLKVFEELPEDFCLFLFAPKDENLLATVESRAIKVLLPSGEDKTDYDAPPLEFASAQELLAELKSSEDELLLEKKFIEERLNKTLKSASFKGCSEELEKLKHYSESEAFNNTKLSRLSLFF